MKKNKFKIMIFAAAFFAAVLIIGFSQEMIKASAKGKTESSSEKEDEQPTSSLDKVISRLKKKSKLSVSGKKKPSETTGSEDVDPEEKPGEDETDPQKPGEDETDPQKPEEEKIQEPVDSEPLSWSDEFTEADLRLLSAIIYCEAADMSEDAGIAVGNVILNRMRDKKDWGHVNTIKEVIYDQKWGVQFTPIKGNPSLIDKAMEIYDNLEAYEGKWQYRQMQKNISAAKKALSGEKVIPDTYMYFNGSIEASKAKCESKGKSYIIIDHHIYF